MFEPRGRELILRYKQNYSIPEEADVSEEMILRHWELEKKLTRQLLDSRPENRWEVFDRCYSILYKELDWLNRLSVEPSTPPEAQYKGWVDLIGPAPKRIYEIGSGKGRMISYLASLGYECRATEITRERGEKHVSAFPSLTWAISDGVHLDKFEQVNSYDVVVSDQVIEHLHPEDVVDHFKGVRKILKNKGRYIFAMPHKFFGPWDVSRIFKKSKPKGMHLKEYTVYETVKALRSAGFVRVGLARSLDRSIRYGITDDVAWLSLLERVLSPVPKRIRDKMCEKKSVFPIQYIHLIAEK
jgi:SAM-dependent methyltransferase